MQINRGIVGMAVVAVSVRAPRGPFASRLLEVFLLRGKVGVESKGTPRLRSRGCLFFFFFFFFFFFLRRSSCTTGQELGKDALRALECFQEVVISSSALKGRCSAIPSVF